MKRLYDASPRVLQDLACTWAGYRRSRERFTPHFHRILRAWEAVEASGRQRVLELARGRLDELVSRAREHVPHYRTLDLPPPRPHPDPSEAIARTLASLPALPKEVLRDRPSELIAGDVPRSRLLWGRTSGTTGTPLRFCYLPETLAEKFATIWRHRRRFGVDLDDPFLTFGGQLVVPVAQRRPPFWRRNLWWGQTLFSVYHLSATNLPAYVDAVHRLPAEYVQGYPSALGLVASAMLEEGRPLPEGRLKGVFTSSESLTRDQQDNLEAAFRAPVRDYYGTAENVGSISSRDDGCLHPDLEYCLVEIDPMEERDGWVTGPLLLTGLSTYAMPLLRYRVGDLGTGRRMAPGSPCLVNALRSIDGRVEDYVRTPDGRQIGRLDHVFKTLEGIAEAQVIQREIDSLEVRVVPTRGWGERAEQALRKELVSRVGGGMELRIDVVDALEREPGGKLRAVKSLVAPDTLRDCREDPPERS